MPGGVVSMAMGLWWVSSLISILHSLCRWRLLRREGPAHICIFRISNWKIGSDDRNSAGRRTDWPPFWLWTCINSSPNITVEDSQTYSSVSVMDGPNRVKLPAALMLCCPVCLWVMSMKTDEGSHRCSTPIKIEQEFKLMAWVLACCCKISYHLNSITGFLHKGRFYVSAVQTIAVFRRL